MTIHVEKSVNLFFKRYSTNPPFQACAVGVPKFIGGVG
jgi:hypothetical protein